MLLKNLETEKKMKKQYIALLLATKRKGIDNLIEWLETTDFFTSPASTNYHLSKEGGLLEHSLNVYDELLKEIVVEGLDINNSSLVIVSLSAIISLSKFI